MDGLVLGQREGLQGDPQLLGPPDRPAYQVVALAERDPLPHQVVGQVGGQHPILQGGGHPVGVELEGVDHPHREG